jgi:histidinol dehydrogenase
MRRFDHVQLDKGSLKVSEAELEEAYRSLRKNEINAIKRAMKNIRLYHLNQKRGLDFTKIEDGIEIAQILRPILKIGIYVPGGMAIYPSSVLMTVIPARIAGAKKVILCTPPRKDGKINPAVLVAAREAGVDAIFKIGGAQAIAAMAYGTETVPKVEKIVGPGNIYVTAAKILVNQEVAIDMPAGPSEILVLADESANPRFVASDLIAQSEHSPDAFAVLVTPSKPLAEEVLKQIELLKKDAKRSDIIEKALDNNGWIFVVKDITQGLSVVNQLAPEHLEIILPNPFEVLDKIENAGAIFLGEYSAVVADDYAAGSNHVLPTGGYAKAYSGLSIRDFTKAIDVVHCTKDGLRRIKDTIFILARMEGFDSHERSVAVRFEKDVR